MPVPAPIETRLELADPPDGAAWDRFVEAADGATFCHLWAWRAVMEDALGHECLYRAAVRPDGSWAGLLPLVRMKSRLLGHYLVSMPFLNYGGPLGTPDAQRTLAHWAAAEAERSRADLLELRARREPALPPGLRTAQRKVTVVLELPDAADALWQRFGSKLRSQVRRPQKEGMETRFGADQADAFYAVFSRHMRDLGTPVLPRRLFERIAEAFGERVAFGAVYRGAEPVAAGCGFLWRGEFEMTWASALREHSRAAPNMLLYWAFMEEMIRRGARAFNFGRCTPGGGTHRFKLQWGGREEPLPWAHWSRSGQDRPPDAERGVFRLAVAAWQRLPLPIANRIGPVVARRIATF